MMFSVHVAGVAGVPHFYLIALPSTTGVWSHTLKGWPRADETGWWRA